MKIGTRSILYSVYALTQPGTGAVRYVGITRVSLKERLVRHIVDARKNGETNHRSCWLRSLEARGLRPGIALLEQTDEPERERYWIRHFREAGADLANGSDGCESHIGYDPPPQVRAAISAAKRGRPISPEHRAALLQAITGRPMSDTARAAIAEANRLRREQQTHCANGHEYTPENTNRRTDGYRECRTCRQATKRRHNDRLKAARRARGLQTLKGRPWSPARRLAHEEMKHAG